MRNVWRAIGCAGLIVGLCGAAAAEEVKIWVPTPVKAADYEPPVVQKTKVRVVNVVVVGWGDQRFRGRDWVLSDRRSGFTRVYSGPLYPF
jgi:hypothetical protein